MIGQAVYGVCNNEMQDNKERLEEEDAVIYEDLQHSKRKRLGVVLGYAELGTSESRKWCSTNQEMSLYKWVRRIPKCIQERLLFIVQCTPSSLSISRIFAKRKDIEIQVC